MNTQIAYILTGLIYSGVIAFLIFSIYFYINRDRIMNKYDLDYVATPLLVVILIIMPLSLIIQLSRYDSINSIIADMDNTIGPIIGTTFWLIIGLIIIFTCIDFSERFKYLIGKLVFSILLTLSLGFFLIYKFFGVFISSPSSSSSSSNYNYSSDTSLQYTTAPKSYHCSFVDGRGFYRELGQNFYDGRGILREYGDNFYDSKNILRNFGDNYYDSSGILRSFGDNFIDTSGNLRYFTKK